MDMTSSTGVNVGASTSQNNSNNKITSFQSNHVVVRSSEIDDSPINSPEFLPANSVSYHQVNLISLELIGARVANLKLFLMEFTDFYRVHGN